MMKPVVYFYRTNFRKREGGRKKGKREVGREGQKDGNEGRKAKTFISVNTGCYKTNDNYRSQKKKIKIRVFILLKQ